MTTSTKSPDEGELKPCRHGHTVGRKYSPTYHSWQAMLGRARYVERDKEQKHVGRGISVCERWRTFGNFLEDMGERPSGTTLDRKDNDGDYSPANCQWSTPIAQARNRRNTKLNFEQAVEVARRMLDGELARVVAADFGLSESLPREILKGRTWKDALIRAREFSDE